MKLFPKNSIDLWTSSDLDLGPRSLKI